VRAICAGQRCDRNMAISRHNVGAIPEQRGESMGVRGLDVSAAETADSPSGLTDRHPDAVRQAGLAADVRYIQLGSGKCLRPARPARNGHRTGRVDQGALR
jgi:hypothetical protein